MNQWINKINALILYMFIHTHIYRNKHISTIERIKCLVDSGSLSDNWSAHWKILFVLTDFEKKTKAKI